MPSLTIKPPRPLSERNTSSSPSQHDHPVFTAPLPSYNVSDSNPPEPVAPEYSPITPKVQPVFPAIASTRDGTLAGPPASADMQPEVPQAAIASDAQYIPQPPSQPFSSEDSTDAIALRAAISALQFQKKKARDDLRTLETMRQHALTHPKQFRDALAAGRLHEHRPRFGGLQAILDAAESDDDDDDDDANDDDTYGVDETVLGASMEGTQDHGNVAMGNAVRRASEVPDSQSSRGSASYSQEEPSAARSDQRVEFSQVPGPQDVVRMPHINWDKYHIVGEPLERMHEQQRRWPGGLPYGQDRGREFTVAAPYSPFLDVLDGQGPGQDASGYRKDSAAVANAAASPTGTVSEHPMETRRSSKMNQ